jgi:hypothetical protein
MKLSKQSLKILTLNFYCAVMQLRWKKAWTLFQVASVSAFGQQKTRERVPAETVI